MRKILFLDRDGVINREMGRHVWEDADFEILSDVTESIALAKTKGYEVIVVTNQSGVSRGFYSLDQVHALHRRLDVLLAERGLAVLEYFICPHLPEHSRCLCRKPGSLMIEKALAKYKGDKNLSVLVGDRETDVEAAVAAGIRGIQIESNSGLLQIVKNLAS